MVCVVESSLAQIAAVLLDIKKQDEWFYETKSTLLKEVSPTELYYYSQLYFPFPMNNRDFVEHIVLSQDKITKALTMTVENLPEYIPVKKGVVRILHSNCKWLITPLSKKSLLVEFTLFADPGGSIPVWLINAMSYYAPLETFKKLKIQLAKPPYQNMLPAFIDNY